MLNSVVFLSKPNSSGEQKSFRTAKFLPQLCYVVLRTFSHWIGFRHNKQVHGKSTDFHKMKPTAQKPFQNFTTA